MNRIEKMTKSVVKVVTENNIGTGFFFVFEIEDYAYPYIITNKHVIGNSDKVTIRISLKPEGDIVNKKIFEISGVNNIKLNHSSGNVDLCAIPAIDIFNENHQMDIAYLTQRDIQLDAIKNLNFVEEILMVGYPRGISDEYNNLPVFRKGITATHPGIKFNNQKLFLIDMTITNGSSGSPVYLYNPNGYTDRMGNAYLGQERFLFLGVNFADNIMETKGYIVKDESIDETAYGVTELGINLGVIIHAEELLDFEEQIKNMEDFRRK